MKGPVLHKSNNLILDSYFRTSYLCSVNQEDKTMDIHIDFKLAENKNEKAIILIILRRSHADGMRAAKRTGNDYGLRRQRKGGTL